MNNLNDNNYVNQINDFMKNYRESLKTQLDANKSLLDENRRQSMVDIMSSANSRGTMYSNLPQRQKIQYDTQTYLPAYNKLYTSYQTGLDKLRSTGASLANQIKSVEEAIDEMNKGTYVNTNS